MMKYKLFVILCLILLYSCNTKEPLDYKFFSESIIGKGEYKNIFQAVEDTLANWKLNKLIGTSESCNYSSFEIDSILCFNKNKNKIVMAILESECKEDVSDGIKKFYGVKIKERWYFFSGAYIVLPREQYQQDVHTPLSFSKLHEIAMQEVFSGYLIETKTKKNLGWWKNTFSPEYEYEYQINDKFFEGMETKNQSGRGYGSCFECKTFEEYVLYLVQRNWQKK